jgi:hypothetical protein
MAIIIETCPKCGHDLVDVIIATYPPIPKKECWNCGWYWEGEREEIVRRPFGGNSLIVDDLVGLQDYTNLKMTNVSVGDGVIGGMLATSNTINVSNVKELNSIVGNFEQSACINCPSNPKNGGDGICFCTAGQMHVAY